MPNRQSFTPQKDRRFARPLGSHSRSRDPVADPTLQPGWTESRCVCGACCQNCREKTSAQLDTVVNGLPSGRFAVSGNLSSREKSLEPADDPIGRLASRLAKQWGLAIVCHNQFDGIWG